MAMDDGTEFLTGGITVHTDKDHRLGTDAFLLADFCHPKEGSLCCDLGTGCGIIPLLWMKRSRTLKAWGVDIQPEAIRLFEQSVKASSLAERVFPLCADLRQLPAGLPKGGFDLVSCNPPYKKAGGGILSQTAADQTARHETMCTLDEVCKTAAELLRFGGRLCICQRPERLADAMAAMRAHKLEPKRLRLVAKNAAGEPWLFLLEGRKGGKPFLRIEPQFNLYENGEYTAELAELYR